MVDALAEITVFLALALALALLVERLLEVLKSLYDVFDARLNLATYWSRRAADIADRLERRLRVFEYVSPDAVRPALNKVYELLLNTQGGYSGTALVLSGDLVRVAGVRLGCKIVGMAVGVALAFWLKVDFVALWKPPAGLPHAPWQWIVDHPSSTLIASGVAIGLGAGPVHKIITAIERQQAARNAPSSKDQKQ